jgi:hypothetical protein
MRSGIATKTRAMVRQRANQQCEYCRLHEDDSFLPFSIDHIASLKHGGGNEPDNLAFACLHCNQNKGSDLTTFLESYDDIVILFNPRVHMWPDHFDAIDGEIIAKTRIGQASLKIFKFNEPDRLILRQLLALAGRYP